MQHVQFSIIKCCFYTRNGIYHRGYTHFIFILFIFIVCSKQIPAIYEIVQVVMVLGRTYLTRIVSQMACVR